MNTSAPSNPPFSGSITFVGGGNMASAIIGGLLQSGVAPSRISVVEPHTPQAQLHAAKGMAVSAAPTLACANAEVVVWAVKPQSFAQAAAAWVAAAPVASGPLHLSVMAGVRTASMAAALGLPASAARIVRTMPNTPALVGLGMTGLWATAAVSSAQRASVSTLLQPTGELMWLDREAQLDAVTAVSGSGPAYVFYFLEALTQGGIAQGLSEQEAKALALQTFKGATALAQSSTEPLAILRERVTSKGGTTYAALEHMRQAHVAEHIEQAVAAAAKRAEELGAS